MLPILQVVTKNDLLKRKASIFLEKMFIKYGIDHREIVYAELSPLFKNAPGFIIKKFELDKKLSSEDFKEFKMLCGIKASPAASSKPVAPPPPPPVIPKVEELPPPPIIDKPKATYPINKPKGTRKTN